VVPLAQLPEEEKAAALKGRAARLVVEERTGARVATPGVVETVAGPMAQAGCIAAESNCAQEARCDSEHFGRGSADCFAGTTEVAATERALTDRAVDGRDTGQSAFVSAEPGRCFAPGTGPWVRPGPERCPVEACEPHQT